MRKILFTFVGIAFLSPSPLFAAEEPKTSRAAHPVAQHLKDIGAAWPQPGVTMQGNIGFVFGNELWQPKQQFKTGRDWLALACSAKGCALEPALLTVKQDFWLGHYDDKPTFGQRLSFKRDGGSGASPVAWFRTAAAPAWLKPGAVATYYSPQHPLRQPPGRGTLEALIDLPNGKSAELVPMLATSATMRQASPQASDSRPAYFLQLRALGKRQLLLGDLNTCWGEFHPRKYLQWSGDLDRDGLPDFLISFIDQEGPVHLYLSSAAKPGQLVGLAGVYVSPPFGGECDSEGWLP